MPKAPLALQIGNPIIRKKLRTISPHDLKSEEVLNCIEKMRAVNLAMKGVGISANQVGYDLRISIIHIRSSKNRPGLKTGREVILINPELIHTPGKTEFMWEGCLSVAQAGLFCKVKRFKSVEVKYLDLSGSVVIEKLIGLEAHVAQHELDHLDGRVFLDQEFDPKTFMSSYEYRLMRKSQTGKKT